MKPMSILMLLSFSFTCLAEEKIAVKSKSGRFEITQEYRGEFLEIVRFGDPELFTVRLSGYQWSGSYEVSPDEEWIFRTQKTGSGDSIAILYRVEKNGRVSEVLGLDGLLWQISDTASRLKKKQLYHTAIVRVTWAKDSSSLEIVLRGSNASKNGDGIETHLVYHLAGNKAVHKTSNSEQGSAGQAPTRPESKSK